MEISGSTVKLKDNLYYFLICFVITMEFAETRIKQIRLSLSEKCFCVDDYRNYIDFVNITINFKKLKAEERRNFL